ncbi:MAG: GNAT family N-acetyltransferase [Firmicutes bacterium]|nr:GNAT family N-acetyltransferase [Bacillota bacterium]
MEKPSENLVIRGVEKKDAKYLLNLSIQLGYSVSYEKLEKHMNKIIGDDDHIIYVAQNNEKVVGWIHAYIYKLFYADLMVEIGGIVVDKSKRKKGIGNKLMKEAENWGREKGCSAINLRSNIIRKNAHIFYENLGFKNVKKQFTFHKKL